MLETRKELSVYAQMADFYDMASNPPLMVLRPQVLTMVREVYQEPDHDSCRCNRLWEDDTASKLIPPAARANTCRRIPQFVCYSDLPHKKGMMVACTQPRRIAATSVAKRVADEMDCGSSPSTLPSKFFTPFVISDSGPGGRILRAVRRHDGARNNVPQVHDRRDAAL